MGVSASWPHRIASILKSAPDTSLLICNRDAGIEHGIRCLGDSELPLLWFWATEDLDETAQGEELSVAVHKALGAPLFIPGLDVLEGLEALRRELPRIGPLQVVVGWLENCSTVMNALKGFIRSPNRLTIVGSREPMNDVGGAIHLIDSSMLAMREAEAIDAASGILSRNESIALMAEVNGKYGAFVDRLAKRLLQSVTLDAIHPELTPRDGADGHSVDPRQLFKVLMARSRWIEALELACSACPDVVPEAIEMAGHQLANLGAFDYLGALLSRLPPDIRTRPKVAYWLLASAIATNRIDAVRRIAESALESEDAPEIRATLAVLKPTGRMVNDTSEAVRASDTPVTLRAHAFALAYDGDREAPIHLFRSAMRMAEQQGADHLVIACAIDIANHETALGRYTIGAEWARWALFEYHRRGLREDLRRQSAVTGIVFPSILSGELEGVASLVDGVGSYTSKLGVPIYESVGSTLGDWEFVNRRFEGALVHYRRVYESVGVDQSASAGLDLVRCYLASNDEARALELATRIHAVAQSSSRQERAFAELALGMALTTRHPKQAMDLLHSSIEGLQSTCFVVLQAQASIWLSILRLEAGDVKSARDVLSFGRDGLQELGASGWQLLSGFHPMYGRVKALWESSSSGVVLRLLGARTIERDNATVELPLRFGEILALLASHPEGLKCQRLQAMLFGDGGTEGNVKAALSKLRKLIPISQSPYRLDVSVQVDFLEVMSSLSAGETQRALNLYRGQLLAESEAPGVVELRAVLDESLRQAVLESGDSESIIQLATTIGDDLELWEAARGHLLPGDHRRPMINARIRRIRATW